MLYLTELRGLPESERPNKLDLLAGLLLGLLLGLLHPRTVGGLRRLVRLLCQGEQTITLGDRLAQVTVELTQLVTAAWGMLTPTANLSVPAVVET